MDKRWLRLHSYEWLEGSIRRELTGAERAVWADLLALASLARRRGYVERSEGIPYTIRELCDKFNECEPVVQSCVDKCLEEGRLIRDGYSALVVANWGRYQYEPPADKTLAAKAKRRSDKEEALRKEREYLQAAAESHERAERLSGEVP